MKGRRTLYELYWEILVFCRKPRTATAIVSRCDLNSKTASQYLSFLQKKGYLALEDGGNRRTYSTTDAGQGYIALFNRMYQELFDDIPVFKLG